LSFPRVLVVTGSAGHGHVKAARAIASALRSRHPTLEVEEMDALAHVPRWFRETYRRGYLWMVDKAPHVWRRFYESTDREDPVVGHAVSMFAGRRFVRRVLAWRPDLIVCTHFLAPELLGRAVTSGRLAAPVHVAITDHDCHRAWWRPHVEAYYVASDLVKARLMYRWGIRSDRVHVTGIPIGPAFSQRRDVVSTRARFGLDSARPTVLFLSGGFSTGPVARSVAGIWGDRPDAQILAVCGHNERLRGRLQALPRPPGGTLHVLGFVDDVPDLMAVSDVVVGKSGGLTTSECMAMGKPFVVSASIAGQEERNADAVVTAGAGVRALTAEEVRWQVVRLVGKPDDLRATAARARAFGRPHAADDVADRVAERLGMAGVWAPPAHGARASVPRGALR
jgi:processive 1,2-diacylglycerol beta-glucosyltransferase